MKTATEGVKDLLDKLSDLDRLIKNDAIWAPLAEEIVASTDLESQKRFWIALDEEIRRRETKIGACHKGQIYWKLALLSLSSGALNESIEYLDKAVTEDKRRGGSFSAAIGLQSVIRPLVFRYKGSGWKFDKIIMEFYELLSPVERGQFASILLRTHDLLASGALNVIKPDFFTFIQDEGVRRVVQSSYFEVLDILGGQPLKTYYSCIFSTGSILEGMLDDLFVRDAQRFWHLFRDDSKVMDQIGNRSRMQKTEFEPGMTLGEKIFVLRALATYARSPVPKEAILLMLIIAEYRDLIHPRRRLEFEYEANAYVAGFIFTLLSHVAGYWWPENLDGQLASRAHT